MNEDEVADMMAAAVRASTVSVDALAKALRQIHKVADCVFGVSRYGWFMRPKVYSSLLPVRRRKLQPYIRKALARC